MAPFGENRMSKKYLVLELWSKNLKIGNFGPDFQMRISQERKEQTENQLDFHEEQRQYFLNAPCQIAAIFTPSARKTRSKIRFSNGTEFTFPDNISNIFLVPVVESFWFFVSSKNLIVGSFWSKPHVRKSYSSEVMAKNVNFEKSAKNGKNGGFSCFSQIRITVSL